MESPCDENFTADHQQLILLQEGRRRGRKVPFCAIDLTVVSDYNHTHYFYTTIKIQSRSTKQQQQTIINRGEYDGTTTTNNTGSNNNNNNNNNNIIFT
jgi:hypothetical protein